MQINLDKGDTMKDITQKDVNEAIVSGVQPAIEKGASLLGKAKPAPSVINKIVTKFFSFVWSLICFPFLPIINM